MTAAIILLLLCPAAADLSEPDEAVRAGRKALDPWVGEYPWYDAETDGLRRVEAPDQPEEKPEKQVKPRDASSLGTLVKIMAWTVIGLLVAAGIFALVWALFLRDRLPSSAAGGAGAAGDKDARDRIEALPFPVQAGRGDLLDAARQCYQQGEFGQAIICLFSYQLIQLDKRRIIRLAKGKTNRQYLREVGSGVPLRELVEQTMVAFEDFFFGNHPITRGRFETCWSRVEQFKSLAGVTAE